MNVRELNDEQAEQLGKTLEAWNEVRAYWERVGIVVSKLDRPYQIAGDETRKLQEMLQPPKQYLVVTGNDRFEFEPQTARQLCMRAPWPCSMIKALYEWQDGVGTVGEPITGEALRELLEGSSK